jgi:hypothetical protein
MNPLRYPAAPHLRRHGPRGYTDVASYRPWLRDEFTFRCVYCLFREQWGHVKAGFSLDHFLPVAVRADLKLSYDNLLYVCAAFNQSKGGTILPDPTRALIDGSVRVGEDGRIEPKTRAARRIIRVLGLDGREETEARFLWIGIIALAQRCDPELNHRLMGFPDKLPELTRLRPPGGNTRPEGLTRCFHALRRDDTLPPTY